MTTRPSTVVDRVIPHRPLPAGFPWRRPWEFSGGTIKVIGVDVSGEAYLDIEKEAFGMMKRD